jgi:hypothetical protein
MVSSSEIENKHPKNPTGVSKGTEAEYGKKSEIYNGTIGPEYGSNDVHETDFHKG